MATNDDERAARHSECAKTILEGRDVTFPKKKVVIATVSKTGTHFNSSHFLIDYDGPCGFLHGHTWRLDVKVTGAVRDNGMVLDFKDVKDSAERVASLLDHKVIFPRTNKKMVFGDHVINKKNKHIVTIRWGEFSYSGPDDAIYAIEVPNCTCECIARWIANEIHAELSTKHDNIQSVTVDLWEGPNSMVTVKREGD